MAKISIKLLIAVVVVILAFTLIDYAGHKYLEKNASLEQVPSNYFTNKIIFGSILLLGAIWFFGRYYPTIGGYYKTSLISGSTVLLLQLRYLYYGYSLRFHAIVLAMHYLILATLVYFADRKRYLG